MEINETGTKIFTKFKKKSYDFLHSFKKGTEVKYKPGVIIGGKLEHTCPLSRGISYFIEVFIFFSTIIAFKILKIFDKLGNNATRSIC